MAAAITESLPESLEGAGPEGTVFLVFIVGILVVLGLRCVQSIVQKTAYWVGTIIPVAGVILLAYILNRAGGT